MIHSTLKLERLFLHFFDTHFIEDKGTAADSPSFVNEMRLATRLAVASADRVYIPAASYFESPLCRQIIDGLDDLVDLGFIALAGSAINLDEYLRERQDEDFYRKGSVQHSWYRAHHETALRMPYERRKRSATRDVTTHWRQCVQNESLARKIRDATDSSISSIESRLELVPEEMGTLAFIPEHVFEILDLKALPQLVQARIRSVINEGYFESYTRDLDCGVVIDLHHLASDFQIPSYGQNLSYSRMLRFLRSENRIKEFSHCDTARLLQYGREPVWQAALADAAIYIGAQSATSLTLTPTQTASAVTLNPLATAKNSMPSVLCIAAAHVELETASKLFSEKFGAGRSKAVAGGEHYVLEFTDPSNQVCWNLAGQPFQGQVDAAINVSVIASQLNPTITLMVGMCMGMPKKELRVGTVIVPNEVFAYDHQRSTKDGIQFRPHADRVHSRLHRLAQIIGLKEREYRVVVDKGLATASIKIENIEYELVSKIEQLTSDVVAFDMEGSGFYRAAGRDKLWIKAIADSGESQESTAASRGDKHKIQANATSNAVDFAIDLVREYVNAHANA